MRSDEAKNLMDAVAKHPVGREYRVQVYRGPDGKLHQSRYCGQSGTSTGLVEMSLYASKLRKMEWCSCTDPSLVPSSMRASWEMRWVLSEVERTAIPQRAVELMQCVEALEALESRARSISMHECGEDALVECLLTVRRRLAEVRERLESPATLAGLYSECGAGRRAPSPWWG